MADKKTLIIAAKNAITRHIVDLIAVISAAEANLNTIILSCEQEKLITTPMKGTLLDGSTGQSAQDRARQLVGDIQNNVSIVPTCLDTFLCVLIDAAEGSPAIEQIADDIAVTYGHELPKYRSRIKAGGQEQYVQSSNTAMTTVLKSDVASKALIQCTATILNSTVEPFDLVIKLYSKEIIPGDLYKRVKDRQSRDTTKERLDLILEHIKDRVNLDAGIFKLFVDTLRELSRNDLADLIMKKYEELAKS